MGQHDIHYMTRGHDDHTFRCKCGETPPNPFKTFQMAQDAGRAHLTYIDRVRVLMAGRHGTLAGDYNHAKAMAENPNLPKSDRDLWKQMADELGHRLGFGLPEAKQEELFTL